MTKQWFVLHTLTGQEFKVKRSIEARAVTEEMQEYIGEVIIPTEKVTEVKGGVKKTSTRKFFPGYIFVNLVLYDDSRNIMEETWRFLRETNGLIGFIRGKYPMPLTEEEVRAVVHQEGKDTEKAKPKVHFEPGDSVNITDGPFMNFKGSIDEVDPDRGKLKVSVEIFGRTAPVELEYWQVERALDEG